MTDQPTPQHDPARQLDEALASDDDVGAPEHAGDAEMAAERPEPELDLSIEALVADVERLAGEREEYLDALRRSQADFENFRKQAQRRLDDATQRALGGFVERLLPVLDACDAALGHGASEIEPIMGALRQALEKEGLVRVDPLGEPFDPAVAEAVVHEPGGGGDHIVSEVLRTGYLWNDRVLRPAMVKVTD